MGVLAGRKGCGLILSGEAALWLGGSKVVAHRLRQVGADAIHFDEATAERVQGRRVFIAPSNAKRDPGRTAQYMARRAESFGAAEISVIAGPLDIADIIEQSEATGSTVTLADLLKRAQPINGGYPHRTPPRADIASPHIFSASDLLAKTFTPVNYLVHDMLPAGAFLLAGRPKIGKSWLAYQIASDVARGVACLGRQVNQGSVLLLALEDNERRLHSRMSSLAPANSVDWPTCFQCSLVWPRIDQGAIDELFKWANFVDKPRLIIVDTLARIRPPRTRGDDPYASDYAVGAELKRVSDAFAGLTVIAVTHVRKADAEDPFDKITGTLGLSGAFDGAMLLDRKRSESQGTLQVAGRDLEHDVELGVEWVSEMTRWRIVGEAAEVRASAERRKIIGALKAANEPLLPKEIAEETGLSRGSVRHLVRKLHSDGMVVRHEGKGTNHRYAINK